MHVLVIQRYTFYNLNYEIENLLLWYAINSQLIFKTLDFQAPYWNKTFFYVILKHVEDIRKIMLHCHKTLTLGVCTYNVNVRFKLL